MLWSTGVMWLLRLDSTRDVQLVVVVDEDNSLILTLFRTLVKMLVPNIQNVGHTGS
jgi:hypothetical protein